MNITNNIETINILFLLPQVSTKALPKLNCKVVFMPLCWGALENKAASDKQPFSSFSPPNLQRITICGRKTTGSPFQGY